MNQSCGPLHERVLFAHAQGQLTSQIEGGWVENALPVFQEPTCLLCFKAALVADVACS